MIYRLPLRATQGFVASIFELLKLPLIAPDYSLLCLRQKRLSLIIPDKKSISEGMHLVIDSTGLKLYGEGEWKVRKSFFVDWSAGLSITITNIFIPR